LKQLKSDNELWNLTFKNLAEKYNFKLQALTPKNNEDTDIQPQIPKSYFEAIKFKAKYLDTTTKNTYRMISDRGLLTIIVAHSGLEDDEEIP
jgi:hypothetical protein